MYLVQGKYSEAIAKCQKILDDDYFEFEFLYTDESERFREIDRFLYESRHTLRFENEYRGNVVIDISGWSEKTNLYSVLDVTAEKTASCIYSTIKQVLKPFTQNKSLLELLCEDEISYSELTEKKTAIYIIYPDEKKTLNFLITLFLTQCYQYLVNYSTKFRDSRLPIRVNFVLDEFSNLPCIDNFDNCISEARGHNIRYFLFGQSKGQLKNKYGDIANTIISNCEWIIFPSKEYSFLDTVSKMCGREYDYYGNEHDLLSVCDIQHLKKYDDGAEVLILKSGQFPFVTKLPDYEYVDIFNHYPDAVIEDVSRRAKAKYITFGEWIDGFGGKFKFPFLAGKKNTNKG